jgi:SapC
MTTEPVSLPLFYQSLEPFEGAKHGDLALPKKPIDFLFAANTNVIPVLVDEVALALHHFALLFVKEKNASTPTLVALVGKGDGKNQFVDAKGQWRLGSYIPAWVRRYPFMLVPGQNDNGMLAFDAKAAMLQPGPDKEKLLEADGKPTKAMQQVIEFQKRFLAGALKTEKVVKSLFEANVLEESGLTVPVADGDKPVKIQGFMVVNEQKLNNLKADELEKLHRDNALGLAYAQLFSMNSLRNLANTEKQ